jgi:hypothetical protein
MMVSLAVFVDESYLPYLGLDLVHGGSSAVSQLGEEG